MTPNPLGPFGQMPQQGPIAMPPGAQPGGPLEALMAGGPPPAPAPDPETDEARARRLLQVQTLWAARISAEQEAHKDFRDRAREVHKIYRARVGSGDDQRVPLYWEVVNVEHAGVYSSQPVPDCRPRNDEKNPVFRQAADILERALAFCVDDQSFDDNMHRGVDDFLAVGLGVLRIKLEAKVTGEEIGDQMLKWQYVPWARFGWEPCNHWGSCDWVYFRHPMTRKQIKARFGRDISGSVDDHLNGGSGTGNGSKRRGVNTPHDIYEIWDKKARRVIFLAKGEQEPLEINEDPLELKNFFPVPTPMMTNLGDEELIPKPDYDYIQFFDREINRLQERRASLMESMKAAGAYDSGLPELADMMELEDGEYQPIQNMMQRLAAAGGPDALIYHLPMQEKMAVIQGITEQIAALRAQVDEILGISDIVRGVTNASETATAQEIKGRWVGVRLSRKRELVQYTVREMFRIMAQILVSHFTPENLQRLTQVQASPETLQLLQSDLMMDFSIDIETESTVAKDEFRERETRQEMLQGLAAFSQGVLPMVQQGLLPADVSSAVLRAALQPYTKYSRGLDESLGTLQDTQQQLQGMSQQMQQLQQQLQQAQQQAQQWQQAAQQLQMRSTEATSQQRTADAQKKMAETQKIVAEMPNEQLQPQKTVAEIGKLQADTIVTLRPNGQG